MSVCKRFGYPDLFITFTCNSNWPEIKRFVEKKNLRPDEKPDISCRLFHMKVEDIMSDLRKGDPFGKLDASKYHFFLNLIEIFATSILFHNEAKENYLNSFLFRFILIFLYS